MRHKHGLHPLVIHDDYLINLASAGPGIRAQSIAAFRGEIERGFAIGAEYLVTHPGNYKGQTIEQGLLGVVHAIAESTPLVIFLVLKLRRRALTERHTGARSECCVRIAIVLRSLPRTEMRCRSFATSDEVRRVTGTPMREGSPRTV